MRWRYKSKEHWWIDEMRHSWRGPEQHTGNYTHLILDSAHNDPRPEARWTTPPFLHPEWTLYHDLNMPSSIPALALRLGAMVAFILSTSPTINTNNQLQGRLHVMFSIKSRAISWSPGSFDFVPATCSDPWQPLDCENPNLAPWSRCPWTLELLLPLHILHSHWLR